MATTRADAVVIGMGPGGEEVAECLADAGLDVVGIEAKLVGGECPYWGCIPSKMMIRAADLLAEARRIPGMAGAASVTPSWEPVARRIRDEATDDWNDRVAVERFEAKGGHFRRGAGRLVGPGRVAVGDELIEATRAIVIATGTDPAIPPVPGLADVTYWTNREAIETKEVPESIVVMGGGAVGLELGQVFRRFGAEVTVVEAMDRLLPPEEPESGELVARAFAAEGIAVRTGVGVTAVRSDGDRIVAQLAEGSAASGHRLLVATGRRADLAALGIGSIGLDEQARFIPVDEHLRVAPGVWAVGDVTGKGAFTHVAVYQARIAIADILGREGPTAEYKALPRVTFTDPEVGAVGATEAAARAAGTRVRTGTVALPASIRGWIHKAGNDGFIKVVEDADRGHLVGATSAGPAGGEVLGLLALAVHAEVPTARLRQMIYAYPTFHRAIEAALQDLDSRS
jgi:pyruvate/2-oxoglutarate dehydrogenase complex dihydrolipoamide dehydrogenase (E3) component